MRLPYKLLFVAVLLITMGNTVHAQTKEDGGAADKTACATENKTGEKAGSTCGTAAVETAETTSGCSPTSCRGAKTKFGEAKVISNLRLALIDLKADMEKSVVPSFASHAYDIHGIVGKTDDESLEIIINEVKIVEEEMVAKLNHKPSPFQLPENKAKQIQYLTNRIKGLKALL